MHSLKRLFCWCARRMGAQCRKPWKFCRTRAYSVELARGYNLERNASADTLVDEKHRTRAFSDPGLQSPGFQNVYSYYPWTEDEHEEIMSRSPPPPPNPLTHTFPSLAEMGGLLTL